MARKAVGGFAQPIQLSLFIRDFLADGRETWAFNLYRAYKEAVERTPLSKKKPRRRKRPDGTYAVTSGRHCIKYEGFRTYLYKARKLGLIEYVTLPDGSLRKETAVDKAGNYAPHLVEAIFFRAVPGRLGDSAWSNLQQAAGYL